MVIPLVSIGKPLSRRAPSRYLPRAGQGFGTKASDAVPDVRSVTRLGLHLGLIATHSGPTDAVGRPGTCSHTLISGWRSEHSAREVTPTRRLDELTRRAGRVLDVERCTKGLDDCLFDVARGRVFAPHHEQVANVVDKDDAVRPSGAVLLVIEHRAGECASQSRSAASVVVIVRQPASKLRRDAICSSADLGLDGCAGPSEPGARQGSPTTRKGRRLLARACGRRPRRPDRPAARRSHRQWTRAAWSRPKCAARDSRPPVPRQRKGTLQSKTRSRAPTWIARRRPARHRRPTSAGGDAKFTVMEDHSNYGHRRLR